MIPAGSVITIDSYAAFCSGMSVSVVMNGVETQATVQLDCSCNARPQKFELTATEDIYSLQIHDKRNYDYLTWVRVSVLIPDQGTKLSRCVLDFSGSYSVPVSHV